MAPRTVVKITMDNFPELVRKLPIAVDSVLETTAYRVEHTVKTGMAGPQSGRMYGAHQASAPGEYPAVDTGALMGSITTSPTGKLKYSVWTGIEYAIFLEYGTINMLARPFFGQAAADVMPHFEQALRDLESLLT